MSLDARASRQLDELDRLLAEWQDAVGLVGFKDPGVRKSRYFDEALAALPWVPLTGRAMDIGSGGGSPALPLAIARPSVTWTLVEPNERKALFLEEAVRTLGLVGVVVARTRYERLDDGGFDVDLLTVRGVSLDEGAVDRALRRARTGGRFLWFSSEARLSRAREELSGVYACEGPIALVPGGGFLLVVDRR